MCAQPRCNGVDPRSGDLLFHVNSSAPAFERYCHVRPTDQLLVGDQEPPLGSQLVTPRRGYLHHGIYVGGFKVVHYSGLAHGLRRGPVEEVPIARFARGQRVWVRHNRSSDFEVREIIRRAQSRVGENCYRLLTNNCEHFCEWCLRDKARSLQVEAWLAWPRRTLVAMFLLITQRFSLQEKLSRLR
jgi:hypothetical protein